MLWTKALRDGFFGGRGKVLAAVLFYGAALLFSTVALAPLSAGFDRALSRYPAASDLLAGRGVDLLAELGIHQPGLWGAAFGALGWGLLLSLVAGLYITAGTYGAAAKEDLRPVSSFWARAWRNVLPFAGLFALNAVVWLLIAALLAIPFVAVGRGLREGTDPGPVFRLFWVELAVLAVVANLFRNSLGYAQARYALTDGSEGLGRCFLRAFAFTFRRFVPVNLLTWSVNALRVCLMALTVVMLSPGYTTSGKAFATALLLQAGFFGMAFLRVGEIRAQVAYQRGFLETGAAAVASAPPQPARPAEPDAVPPPSDVPELPPVREGSDPAPTI